MHVNYLKADFEKLQNELSNARSLLQKNAEAAIGASTTPGACSETATSTTAGDWSSSIPPGIANVKKALQDKMSEIRTLTLENEVSYISNLLIIYSRFIIYICIMYV